MTSNTDHIAEDRRHRTSDGRPRIDSRDGNNDERPRTNRRNGNNDGRLRVDSRERTANPRVNCQPRTDTRSSQRASISSRCAELINLCYTYGQLLSHAMSTNDYFMRDIQEALKKIYKFNKKTRKREN